MRGDLGMVIVSDGPDSWSTVPWQVKELLSLIGLLIHCPRDPVIPFDVIQTRVFTFNCPRTLATAMLSPKLM